MVQTFNEHWITNSQSFNRLQKISKFLCSDGNIFNISSYHKNFTPFCLLKIKSRLFFEISNFKPVLWKCYIRFCVFEEPTHLTLDSVQQVQSFVSLSLCLEPDNSPWLFWYWNATDCPYSAVDLLLLFLINMMRRFCFRTWTILMIFLFRWAVFLHWNIWLLFFFKIDLVSFPSKKWNWFNNQVSQTNYSKIILMCCSIIRDVWRKSYESLTYRISFYL